MQLSRVILGLASGDERQADHTNHVTLDNRRSNLRPASPAQNRQNARLRRDTSSGFKGVKFHRSPRLRRRRWQATISANGTTRSLGYFATAEEAAAAYDLAAHELHGQFAKVNGV